MHILERTLLEQFFVNLNLIRDPQVVRNFDQNNTVLQSLRLLVANERLVLMLIGMADYYFIGIDHAETAGLDILFLAEREQHIEKFLIRLQHFYKFHDASICDIEFTIKSIGSRIAFDSNLTDS